MLKAKNYSFLNLPKGYGKEEYEAAIDKIIEKYSKIKGLLSIYSWGDVSVPGISDIDVVFVFKRNAEPLPLTNRSFYFLDAKTRYLVRHPFVFIDEESFKNIKYVYPDTDFKFLHGKNIKINKPSIADKCYSTISLLNDIIIRHYPRDFIEQFVSKRINVRDTLLRLNSLKYSINMFEVIEKHENSGWGRSLNSIKNLRKNWFIKNDFKLLIQLNEDALRITMDFIGKFRIFLMKNSLLGIYYGDNIKYNGIKNKSLFIKNWSKEKALQDMTKIIKNNKKFYSILPIELSAQLIEYSRYDGLISSYIRENISNNLNYQLKHKKIAEKRIKRIRILNEQAKLAFKLKHSDFAAFFDFGYRNKSGINNWVLNLLDKVRF